MSARRDTLRARGQLPSLRPTRLNTVVAAR